MNFNIMKAEKEDALAAAKLAIQKNVIKKYEVTENEIHLLSALRNQSNSKRNR